MNQTAQKAALVTGAARGIGLATAKRFLTDGWRVALLDIDGENLRRTFKAIGKPDATLAIACDVADAKAVARAFETVAQKFRRLDALVNNAGIAIFKPILDVTYEDWSRVLAVNLTGPFLCTQAAAR
jgi:NAD(P)-dependent dehydrogenase (short-subunit alcohol dehydrogenase family)